MTANRIIHHIFSQPDLRQVNQSELEQLVETYPYFAAARMLLAQKQFSTQNIAAPALKAARLYSSSTQQLYQFLQEETAPAPAPTPLPEPEAVIAVPVQLEQEPELMPHTTVEETPEAENVATPPREETIVEAWQQQELTTPPMPANEVSIVDEWQEQDLTTQPDAISQQVEEEWHDDLIAETKAPVAEEDEIVAIDYAPINEQEKIDEIIGEGKDEIVAIDYAPINEQEKIDEIIGEGKDEIVAIDYAPINEQEKIDEIIGEGKDEIVAIDYAPINEQEKIDEIIGEGKDEIVAMDYEAIQPAAYEPEIEEEEIEVETDAAPVTAGITIPPAPEAAPGYEAELEEEEIEVETDAAPIAAGITIPPAPEAAPETGYEPEVEEEEIEVETDAAPVAAGLTIPPAPENTVEGPIRIQPMDTPAEETILTFQPLYTEDYFAYKKLKEPNNAESMNEKGAAEMRSFTDWLRELKDNFAAGQSIRNRYQQQMHKLYEDEEPEVSEAVEKMAIDSITLTNDIVSETLAEIWVRQHQHEKAMAIYAKLSLLNPDKNAYFAQKIKELQLLTDNNK